MQARAHIFVSGLVQGVGYRWFVEEHARALGLTGFVRNLWDGRVEIVVEGDRGLIEELIKDLRVGPHLADVRKVDINWEPYTGEFNDFRIKY